MISRPSHDKHAARQRIEQTPRHVVAELQRRQRLHAAPKRHQRDLHLVRAVRKHLRQRALPHALTRTRFQSCFHLCRQQRLYTASASCGGQRRHAAPQCDQGGFQPPTRLAAGPAASASCSIHCACRAMPKIACTSFGELHDLHCRAVSRSCAHISNSSTSFACKVHITWEACNEMHTMLPGQCRDASPWLWPC